jgi:hypothetical protein|tara:strand:+ start:390 stop:704 length:315 start_codon:yes stop_codon:yes gene_type:complete
MGKRTEKDKMYFDIFMYSSNREMTLEEIGIKYGITKQRAWQIVRFNQLGNGDYYKGYKMYMDKKSEIDKTPGATTRERSQGLRDWLNSQNVRLIKGKYDSSTVG